MNPVTYVAFVDEMTKIALAVPGRAVVRKAGELLRSGWHSGGRFGKVMTVGSTAVMLPEAVAKEDPTGRGRSRAERLSRLTGSTVGGLVGGAVHPGFFQSMAGGLAGGIAGDVAGGHLARLPGKAMRKVRSIAAKPQPVPPSTET